MTINKDNLTYVLATHNSADMLNIHLSTLKYYVADLPPIIIIDHNSTDSTDQIIENFINLGLNIKYIKKEPIDSTMVYSPSYEHSLACNELTAECKTEWILYTHTDIEYTTFGFWERLNEYANCDFGYTYILSPVIEYSQNTLLVTPSVLSHFVLIKKNLWNEATIKCEMVLHQINAINNDNIYFMQEAFSGLFLYALNNHKQINQMRLDDILFHYGGYTRFTLNSTNIPPDIIKIKDYIETKSNYLKNERLPFPKQFNKALEIIIRERIHY